MAKKRKGKMSWSQSLSYHKNQANKANYNPNAPMSKYLYHVLCAKRADQHINGVKAGNRDLRNCSSKCLYNEAVKKSR